MKVNKIFSFFNKSVHKQHKKITSYNPNNVTIEEFREFVHYLAENKINRTFVEPNKFTTEAKKQELQEFRKRIHYLAENGINRTFIC